MRSYVGDSRRFIVWRSVRSILVSVVVMTALTACDVQEEAKPDNSNAWPLAWQDKDGDCQDTETEVLIARTKGLIQWADPDACAISSGYWKSWGTDQTLPLASVLVVMVVVPQNAQESGAQDWSADEKLAFMNDEENLIIMDLASAKVRANYGPDRWVPHTKYWCEYATRWRNIKQRYGLTLSEEEGGATAHMMAVSCEPSETVGEKSKQ